MKKLLVILCVFAFIYVSQAEERVINLGVHPFYKSKDLKPEDLKKIASDRVGDIKMGFEQAGSGELVFAFLEQIQKANIKTVAIQPGDRMSWMLCKEGKKIKVLKDVVWAGKNSTPAYEFTIYREGTNYTFVVPHLCGNISLRNTEPVPAPVCGLIVTPSEVEKGKSFKIDACGGKNVVKNTVTVTDASGAVVKTLELTPDNCTADVTLDNPGSYTVSNQVEGMYGMKGSAPCQVVVKVVLPPPPVVPVATVQGAGAGQGEQGKKLNFIADLGLSRMKDPTTFLFARVGIQHCFSEQVRFNLLVGPFFNLIDNNYGKTVLVVDAIFTFHPSIVWFGAGIGGWLVKNDTKADLIGEVGLQLFDTSRVNGSIFFEGRFGLSDFDNMGNMWRYGLGFRLGLTPQK